MTLWSRTRHFLDESITDAFQIGNYFEGVHEFRRSAIRILLIFFLFVLLANFLATKVFNPSITYHDVISVFIAAGLITILFTLKYMKRFFLLWLSLSVLMYGDVVLMGYLDRTGIQVGAILLTTLMPIIGVYFIGRIGAIGCWVLGVISYSALFAISMSLPPPQLYFGGYSQIYDLFLMAFIALTLSMIIALTLNEAMARALQRARVNLQRAQTSEQERTRFFGAVSHEIRNSINGIFGITTSLMKDDLPEEAQSKVTLIQASGNALVRVLNDTLEITRLESGRLDIQNECFDLRVLMKQVAGRWRLSAEDKGLTFDLQIDKDVCDCINSDSARIAQVLDNLLSNAVKFTQLGQITLKLMPPPADNGTDMVCFSVTDTGCGIHPGRQETIFEPYRQESSGTFSQYGGTGLGLYICRLLAEQLDGKIWLERSDSDTTEFRFALPVGTCVTLPPAQEQHAISSIDALQNLRILAVDDRAPNRRYLETVFSSWEINLQTVDSGEACLQKMETETFDLLLLDLNMPNMSGLELLTHIRELESPNRHVQTIIISAEGGERLKDDLARFGANIFVNKPITTEMLWSALETAVQEMTKAREGKSDDLPIRN